jgi:hypothetical protein
MLAGLCWEAQPGHKYLRRFPIATMRLKQTITPETRGLSMSVYRCALTGGCTKGASSRHNEIWIASDHDTSGLHHTRPLFRQAGSPITYEEALKRGMPCFQIGVAGDRRHALPILKEGQADSWFMFGGNFAHTSDSRGSNYPIHIHDRTEDGQACVPFYGAGDGAVETDGYGSCREFQEFLSETLIPDCEESGSEGHAGTYRTALKFLRNKLP